MTLAHTSRNCWEVYNNRKDEKAMDALAARCPALGPATRLKLAINQEHAGRAATIRPGDEVAVFEPVTGG